MAKLSKFIQYCLIFFTFYGCIYVPSEPQSTVSDYKVTPNDIVVLNYLSADIVVLDRNGNFKNVLFSVDSSSEKLIGLAWMHTTKEILVAVDGSDRVMAISPYDGSSRVLISNSNLDFNTNTIGLAQISNGDIIVAETSTSAERFSEAGVRNTTGWPKNLGLTLMRQISPTQDGGFIACSANTDQARKFDSNGNLQATGTSVIAGTTNGYGCIELSNGEFALSWDGTTDSVQVYDSGLTAATTTFNNASSSAVLSGPRGLAQTSDGNILVAEYTGQYLIEITTAGDYVQTLGNSFLKQPAHVLSIPSF